MKLSLYDRQSTSCQIAVSTRGSESRRSYGDGIQMPIWRLPSVNIPIDKTRVAVLPKPAFAVVTILNTGPPAEPPAGQTRHRINSKSLRRNNINPLAAAG